MNLIFVLLTGIFLLSLCEAIFVTNTSRKYSDNPAVWTEDEAIWGPLLEDWVVGTKRTGRVMQIPLMRPAYILEDKIDNVPIANIEKESKISPGKIVTNNNNPNYNNNNNNIHYNNNYNKKPAGRPISETDLYLLSAIEKLVYKHDFMEKRLRRVEEMLYYVMAGNRVDNEAEPCPNSYSRVGPNCYQFSSTAGREYDWKAASKYCKKEGGVLAEMESVEEAQDIIAHIQSNEFLRGKDFWTGGLNPGLLWIWSNSARPVAPGNTENKKNPAANITGEGRCLKLAYDPALRSYSYKGTDCSVRYSIICELPENKSSNEIKRIGRLRKIFDDEL
ncbi:unnamed protein product [Brassicogethes aeneus]|uniref:C-type lectin domain-containing protein n=1 Tax=Brassicogethes aeneus TaxID=1431903 RepID=A0A9P0FJJ5_BRAAE|nr:unnamed protein product [Brassicogethes aeneus]